MEEETEKRKAAEAERDRFKSANKDLTSSDHGAAISKLQRQVRSITYARNEAQKAAKRMERKLKAAEKRVSELEGAGIVTL